MPSLTPLPGRQELIEAVVRPLHLQDNLTVPLLLTLRGSPGSGKTTTLGAIRTALEKTGQVAVLGPWDAAQVSYDELAKQLQEASDSVPPERPKAILIDNLDVLLREGKGERFFELEQRFAYPLVKQKAGVLVGTSQVELPWSQYAVRVRHKVYPLRALTAEEVTSAVQNWELPPPEVYERTLGYPWAMEQLRLNPGLSAAQLADKAAALFLRDLPEEAAEWTQWASLTLAFDVALLRQLAPTILPDESDGFFLDQIRAMRRVGLVNWETGLGYRFADNTVHRLLARHLFYESKTRFEEIHAQARDHYEDAARFVQYLQYNLVNVIYHRAQQLWAVDVPRAARGQECVAWVKEKLPNWTQADWPAVVKAWDSGMGFDAAKEEVIDLTGNEAYQEILQLLKQQIQTPEVAQ